MRIYLSFSQVGLLVNCYDSWRSVIASAAKQSRKTLRKSSGLLRCARNDKLSNPFMAEADSIRHCEERFLRRSNPEDFRNDETLCNLLNGVQDD